MSLPRTVLLKLVSHDILNFAGKIKVNENIRNSKYLYITVDKR